MNDDIAAIGRGYRDGGLTPVDVVRDRLARIDRLDPSLHAFVHLDRAGAERSAAEAGRRLAAGDDRGPLHGIPIAIKDVIDVAGMPTTCHSRLTDHRPATVDATVVARLRAAGAIILGKLATHEFAIGGPSFDLPFPPARNPWNLDHHPGGSSSGAGAGVAAGLFSAAVGTDTAGSVRHPASACGVVGLKPTYELIPRGGVFPLAWSMDHVGVLTRSVADAAIMLDAATGTRGAGDALGLDVAGLKIGLVRHFHTHDMIADAETVAAFERVAAALAAGGADVAEIALPPLAAFADVNRMILQAEGFAIHAGTLRTRPAEHAAALRRALLPGTFLRAADLVLAARHRTRLTAAVEAAFARVDILLTVSSMEPACRIDDPAEIARTYMAQARGPFNLTGHPALTSLSGLSATGLPLSVQFVARRHDEATLVRAAAAWEQARGPAPWPPLARG